MKPSVFFTDDFNEAYQALIKQELPISEVDKIIKIDQEIIAEKQKIIDYKDERLNSANEAMKNAKVETGSERQKEYMKHVNDEVNEYAKKLDYTPSVKLKKEVLMSVRLSAKNYAQLIEFFE